MPVFTSGRDQAPSWCQMQYFDIVELQPGQEHRYERRGKKEKLIVGRGRCRVSGAAAEERAQFDLGEGDSPFAVDQVAERSVLIRMCGDWGEECGGAGVFAGANSETPRDQGDRVDYPKFTSFDCHYHDCDEYWILFEGRGLAYSEGAAYLVGPGDCVATGMGHHHDLARVDAPIRAVYFETTLEGRKRRGHLWDHTHGKAEPRAERV
jgi:mannose-6-phosphate isomerase-like protein (cupin superfamily)